MKPAFYRQPGRSQPVSGHAAVKYACLDGARDRTVLIPVPFADVQRFSRNKKIVVEALLARQFAGVPQPRDPDSITLREEERVLAYYGAGTLYATEGRQEPLL